MNVETLRNCQTAEPVTDLLSTLQSIEINPSELCSRTCGFCPRSDPKLYKNKKAFISLDTCKEIATQLIAMNFTGRIGFVGFGEPLLHPNIVECVKIISTTSAKWIELNTNGDFLTRELAQALADAGCTHIGISMYDSDQTKHFATMLDGINIGVVYRHQYNPIDNYNLNLVNRIDITKGDISLNINRACYLPFYKMFIDWNGDFLLCDQDWARYTAEFNVSTIGIKNFWLDRINKYRLPLVNSDRSVNSPCNKCDVNGLVRGKEAFDLIAAHLSHKMDK